MRLDGRALKLDDRRQYIVARIRGHVANRRARWPIQQRVELDRRELHARVQRDEVGMQLRDLDHCSQCIELAAVPRPVPSGAQVGALA